MNIYAKHGHKVVAKHLDWGYPLDAEKAIKYLTKEQEYTVDYTVVDSWSTEVLLVEFPDIAFNSVHFEDAE